MSKRNRVAPPILEESARWTQAEEEACNAAAAGTPADNEGELQQDDNADNNATTSEQTTSPAAAEPIKPACICDRMLENLAEAEGYRARHIDLQLSAGEQEIVARMRAGLAANHVQLTTGKHVETANDTIRWLIQQISELSIAAAGS